MNQVIDNKYFKIMSFPNEKEHAFYFNEIKNRAKKQLIIDYYNGDIFYDLVFYHSL